MVKSKHNLDLNSYVLLIKTDEKFTQQASIDLRSAGYTPVLVTNLKQALPQIAKLNPAFIVLDYTVTKEEGGDFCRYLRKQFPALYLLLVLDNDELEERIICLEVGADDYVLKPYNAHQFRQFLAFYRPKESEMTEKLHFATLILDLNSHGLVNKGERIDLTTKEFELLKFFMSHPEEILTREQILENVWGYDFQGESNIIEVYIRYLRRKLEKHGEQRLLQTVRGLGYVLRES